MLSFLYISPRSIPSLVFMNSPDGDIFGRSITTTVNSYLDAPHSYYSQLLRLAKYAQRRQWQPTPVLLSGKSHGWRSLVGCIPWGCKESDTTERLHFHSSLSCIGEGNGNPLQCSCPENARDRGAWWAAVYVVA